MGTVSCVQFDVQSTHGLFSVQFDLVRNRISVYRCEPFDVLMVRKPRGAAVADATVAIEEVELAIQTGLRDRLPLPCE